MASGGRQPEWLPVFYQVQRYYPFKATFEPPNFVSATSFTGRILMHIDSTSLKLCQIQMHNSRQRLVAFHNSTLGARPTTSDPWNRISNDDQIIYTVTLPWRRVTPNEYVLQELSIRKRSRDSGANLWRMLECLTILYHYDLRFTGCDAWRPWMIPGQVHGRNFCVILIYLVHFFRSKWLI